MKYRSVNHSVSSSKDLQTILFLVPLDESNSIDLLKTQAEKFSSKGSQRSHVYAAVGLICRLLIEIDSQQSCIHSLKSTIAKQGLNR